MPTSSQEFAWKDASLLPREFLRLELSCLGSRVFTVADPLASEEIGFAPLTTAPDDVAVQWPYAYVVGSDRTIGELQVFVAEGERGVIVYDADYCGLAAPRLVGGRAQP